LGSRPLAPISTKIGTAVRVDDIIIQSNLGFNIFRGFRSTEDQNIHFPIDFAGHRYNSAAAIAQPVNILESYYRYKLLETFLVKPQILYIKTASDLFKVVWGKGIKTQK